MDEINVDYKRQTCTENLAWNFQDAETVAWRL